MEMNVFLQITQVITTWEDYVMFSSINNIVIISSINVWRWWTGNSVPVGLLAPKAVSAIGQVEEIDRNVPLAWSALRGDIGRN